MADDDKRMMGPQVDRRKMLMGIGAAAAAGPGILAAGASAGLKVVPGIMGLNATRIAGWLPFASELEDVAFDLANYADVLHNVPSFLQPGMGSRELVKGLVSVLGGPSSIFTPGAGISVGDLLSPEAKFTYFLRNGGDQNDAAWEQHSMFTGAKSDWSLMQRLFSEYQLNADSKMPLEMFNRALSDRSIKQFGPQMREAFLRDPKGFAEALAEKRNLLGQLEKQKIGELMKPTQEEIKNGEEIPDWEKHYAEAEKNVPANDEEPAHYEIYALDPEHSNGSCKFLFSCKRGTTMSQIQDELTAESLGLAAEQMEWDGHELAVPAGSAAAKQLALRAGVAHSPGKPQVQVHQITREAERGASTGLLSFGS